VGKRHADFGLVRSVTKHDTLVTGTNIKVGLSNVDSSCNIGRLLVDTDENLAIVARQTLRLDGAQVIFERIKSDLTNLFADDGFVIDLSGSSNFTEDHDHVVLGSGLTGNLGVRIGLETRVEDGIGNLIAKLVRVSLIHRLRGEEKVTFFGGNL